MMTIEEEELLLKAYFERLNHEPNDAFFSPELRELLLVLIRRSLRQKLNEGQYAEF